MDSSLPLIDQTSYALASTQHLTNTYPSQNTAQRSCAAAAESDQVEKAARQTPYATRPHTKERNAPIAASFGLDAPRRDTAEARDMVDTAVTLPL
jgi:hypothetical protein